VTADDAEHFQGATMPPGNTQKVTGVGETTRREHEPPPATSRWGWRYHHLGIPTDRARPGEVTLEEYGMHVSGFSTSPYGVEWMRFEPDSPIHELIKTVPHLAFEVDDLDDALEGKTLLGEITAPMAGVRVAMIVHDGAPVELLEFSDSGQRQRQGQ
jgi:hypothetical protein